LAGALVLVGSVVGAQERIAPAGVAPGCRVDLGGYGFHLFCSGPPAESRPTVVLCAGGGDLAVDWWRIQTALADSNDEAVLALGVRPSAYAAVLLHFANAAAPGRTHAALPIVRPSSLEARLVAILNPPARGAALLAATLLAAGLAHGQPPAPDLDIPDRLVAASRIYALVQQYFAHWEGVRRDDVEVAYRDYVDRAVRARSRTEFDLATMRFVAGTRSSRPPASGCNTSRRSRPRSTGRRGCASRSPTRGCAWRSSRPRRASRASSCSP
jgi:hypothetical protein